MHAFFFICWRLSAGEGTCMCLFPASFKYQTGFVQNEVCIISKTHEKFIQFLNGLTITYFHEFCIPAFPVLLQPWLVTVNLSWLTSSKFYIILTGS